MISFCIATTREIFSCFLFWLGNNYVVVRVVKIILNPELRGFFYFKTLWSCKKRNIQTRISQSPSSSSPYLNECRNLLPYLKTRKKQYKFSYTMECLIHVSIYSVCMPFIWPWLYPSKCVRLLHWTSNIVFSSVSFFYNLSPCTYNFLILPITHKLLKLNN